MRTAGNETVQALGNDDSLFLHQHFISETHVTSFSICSIQGQNERVKAA